MDNVFLDIPGGGGGGFFLKVPEDELGGAGGTFFNPDDVEAVVAERASPVEVDVAVDVDNTEFCRAAINFPTRG